MKSIKTLVGIALVAVLALALAACGSSSSSGGKSNSAESVGTGGFQNPRTQPLTGGKRGGVLHVLNETDFEHIDPGQSYFVIDYGAVYATQRPLYSYKPNNFSTPSPDMARMNSAPTGRSATCRYVR